jgi:hypothetical protein
MDKLTNTFIPRGLKGSHESDLPWKPAKFLTLARLNAPFQHGDTYVKIQSIFRTIFPVQLGQFMLILSWYFECYCPFSRILWIFDHLGRYPQKLFAALAVACADGWTTNMHFDFLTIYQVDILVVFRSLAQIPRSNLHPITPWAFPSRGGLLTIEISPDIDPYIFVWVNTRWRAEVGCFVHGKICWFLLHETDTGTFCRQIFPSWLAFRPF